MRIILGISRLARIKAAAAALEISEQEYLRRLIDGGLVAGSSTDAPLDRHQYATNTPPGEPLKEGVLETVPEPLPSVVTPSVVEGSPGGRGRVVKEKPFRKGRVETPAPDPPKAIDTAELREALQEFAEYRRRVKKEPMTEGAWTVLLNALARDAKEHATLAVRWAISQGWKGWRLAYMNGTDWPEVAELLGAPSLPLDTPITGWVKGVLEKYPAGPDRDAKFRAANFSEADIERFNRPEAGR